MRCMCCCTAPQQCKPSGEETDGAWRRWLLAFACAPACPNTAHRPHQHTGGALLLPTLCTRSARVRSSSSSAPPSSEPPPSPPPPPPRRSKMREGSDLAPNRKSSSSAACGKWEGVRGRAACTHPTLLPARSPVCAKHLRTHKALKFALCAHRKATPCARPPHLGLRVLAVQNLLPLLAPAPAHGRLHFGVFVPLANGGSEEGPVR